MSKAFLVDTSSLNEPEKTALIKRIHRLSFIFYDEFQSRSESFFRFMSNNEDTVEEVRKNFRIPDSCHVEII